MVAKSQILVINSGRDFGSGPLARSNKSDMAASKCTKKVPANIVCLASEPSGRDVSPPHVTPPQLDFLNNSSVPVYTPGWRGTVRVKCLAQEHNTVSPARARSGDEPTVNHEATAPPHHTQIRPRDMHDIAAISGQ